MLIGAAGSTPRGIDRVDMGFAGRVFADPDGANVGLLPSPRRMGLLTSAEARGFAGRVEAHWRENRPPGSDALYPWLLRRLAGEALARPMTAGIESGPRPTPTPLRYARLLADARRSLLRAAVGAVPRDAIYLNVGQVLVGWPWFFGWLDRRPDVKPVFMLHDLIPVLYPEYAGPVLSRHHARALRTVAHHATAMIATSQAAADEIREAVERLGRTDLPIHVVPLPVSDSLLAPRTPGVSTPPDPYFVSVGIIDQRKNHRLLLHVWRDMLRAGVPRLPKLVIVGSRGLRVAGLLDTLDRSPGLAGHVIVVNGLSTPAMRELVAGARALLMPSFTEGFGLPIVEALALGTPVIASDIPAHREVGGAAASYLDPLDGPGWRRAVLERAAEDAATLARRRGALGEAAVQTWASYFDAVMPVLEAL